jgi:hypothetical protein
MKTKSIFAFIPLFFFLHQLLLLLRKQIFPGEWKITKIKSLPGDNQLFLSTIKIQLKSDSLSPTRVYENYYAL